MDRWKDHTVVKTGNLNSKNIKKSKAVWIMAPPGSCTGKNWASQTRYTEGSGRSSNSDRGSRRPGQSSTATNTLEPPLYRATICSHVTFERSLPRMRGHRHPKGQGFCGYVVGWTPESVVGSDDLEVEANRRLPTGCNPDTQVLAGQRGRRLEGCQPNTGRSKII